MRKIIFIAAISFLLVAVGNTLALAQQSTANADSNVNWSSQNNGNKYYNGGQQYNFVYNQAPYAGVPPASPRVFKYDRELGQVDKELGYHMVKETEYNVGVPIWYIDNLMSGPSPDYARATGFKPKATSPDKNDQIFVVDYGPKDLVNVKKVSVVKLVVRKEKLPADATLSTVIKEAWKVGLYPTFLRVTINFPEIGTYDTTALGASGAMDISLGGAAQLGRRLLGFGSGLGKTYGDGWFYPGTVIEAWGLDDDPQKYRTTAELAKTETGPMTPSNVETAKKMVAAQNPNSPVFYFNHNESTLWNQINGLPAAVNQYGKLDMFARTINDQRNYFFNPKNGDWSGKRIYIVGTASEEGDAIKTNLPLGNDRATGSIFLELGKRLVQQYGWTADEVNHVFVPVSAGENFQAAPEWQNCRIVFFVFETAPQTYAVIEGISVEEKKS